MTSVTCTVTNVAAHVSFLPTARVQVRGREGWFTATLLFDSGSDRSYVSKDLVAKVRPKWVRRSSVSFSTFGGRRRTLKRSGSLRWCHEASGPPSEGLRRRRIKKV